MVISPSSKRYLEHNPPSHPSDAQESWTIDDLSVSSLADAQAITDITERIKQVILFQKHCEFTTWDELLEQEFEPIKVLDIHPVLRGLFENDCRMSSRNVPCSCGAMNTIPICGVALGHKRICPACSNTEARSRALKMAHKIYNYSWMSLGFLDITCPDNWLDMMRIYEHNYVVSRQDDFIKIIRKFMRLYFPNRPFSLTFHHWHSFNDRGGQPCDVPHFHVHITLINSEFFHNDGVLSMIHRGHFIEPYRLSNINHKNYVPNLEDMRYWLGTELSDDPEKGQCYYQYLLRTTNTSSLDERKRFEKRSWKKLVHHLGYCFRSFIEDANAWLLWADENNECFDQNHYDWLHWHLRIDDYIQCEIAGTFFNYESWNKLTRQYGALSQTQVNKWIDWGTKAEPGRGLIEYNDHAKEAARLYCWSCQLELDLENIHQCDVVPFQVDTAPLRKTIDQPPPWSKMRRWVQ